MTTTIEDDGLRAAMDAIYELAIPHTANPEVLIQDIAKIAAAALRSSPAVETTCGDCGRHIMAHPQPATGWIAKCGNRLTRLDECAVDGCFSSPAVDGVGVECPKCQGRGYVSGDPEGSPIEGCDWCAGTGSSALSPTSDRASVVEAEAPDRDSIRLAQQFVDQFKSGAQGASMDADGALSLAMAIADILAALSPRSS